MTSIVEKLKEYLDFKGFSVSLAEKEVGLSNGSLSKPFNAKTTIKTDTLEKFLKKYSEINPEWLLTGKGDMLKQDNLVNESKEIYSNNMIPLYEDIETIGGTSVVANMSPNTKVNEWIDAGDWFNGATAAIRHYGDSMTEYPSGCILALKEVLDRDLIVWGKNYCIETSEYRVTKRIYDDGDIITAYSTNEAAYTNGRSIHPPFPIPKKSILKIYRVLGYVVKEYSNGPVMISNN